MAILEESYISPVFSDAAQLSKYAQLDFLSRLREYAPLWPDIEDNIAFRDMALFCINAADVPLNAFARHLIIAPSVLRFWTQGQNLPDRRKQRAVEMIDAALYQNGWVGKPPRPPIMDGSNIVPFKPGAP